MQAIPCAIRQRWTSKRAGSACASSATRKTAPCTDTDGNVCTGGGLRGGCLRSGPRPAEQQALPRHRQRRARRLAVTVPDSAISSTLRCRTAPRAQTRTATPARRRAARRVSAIRDHVLPNSKPCADTGNECAAAGCDGAGQCDQAHTPVQDSTPCTDTDQNECTTAGLPGRHLRAGPHHSGSTPCPDTDMDECTMAGCNAAGMCDQAHITIRTASRRSATIHAPATSSSIVAVPRRVPPSASASTSISRPTTRLPMVSKSQFPTPTG